MDGGPALRIESCIESAVHTDPIRHAQSATRGRRYRHRVGDDPLGCDRCVATLSMGGRSASALFRLGLNRERVAVVDHRDELGPLGFNCRGSCGQPPRELIASETCSEDMHLSGFSSKSRRVPALGWELRQTLQVEVRFHPDVFASRLTFG